MKDLPGGECFYFLAVIKHFLIKLHSNFKHYYPEVIQSQRKLLSTKANSKIYSIIANLVSFVRI